MRGLPLPFRERVKTAMASTRQMSHQHPHLTQFPRPPLPTDPTYHLPLHLLSYRDSSEQDSFPSEDTKN